MSNDTVGFIQSPNCGRGTIDLLWSCLSTLILCVWTALHPMIFTRSATNKLKARISSGIISLLVPEIYAAKSIDDFLFAIMLRGELKKLKGWESWSLQQSFIIALGGVRFRSASTEDLQKLDRRAFLRFANTGIIQFDMLPTNDDIDKRNKSDWVTKLIALGQTVWFTVNLVYRLTQGYQVSLVEDITAAYVLCGSVMYGCYMQCPQDVRETWTVAVAASEEELQTTSPRNILKDNHNRMAIFICVLFALVQAVHLAAWNYPFPSLRETWLWRSACLVLVAGFLVIYESTNLERFIPNDSKESKGMLRSLGFFTAGLLYGTARIILIVLAFSSLRKAPRKVYDVPEWTAYWPHIGN